METNNELNRMKIELATHEVQCEERWKTTFQRLGGIDSTLERLERLVLTVGGIVIMFLAGLVVTLATVPQ
jgi:hypothetical protein